VNITHADVIPEGWALWLKWLEVCRQAGYPSGVDEEEMLRVDAGRNLGFTRVVARR
jgi:hypothetical protein